MYDPNDRCDDPDCGRFGDKLVRLGYGFPVCPSSPHRRNNTAWPLPSGKMPPFEAEA
jgi:hypothetical protein